MKRKETYFIKKPQLSFFCKVCTQQSITGGFCYMQKRDLKFRLAHNEIRPRMTANWRIGCRYQTYSQLQINKIVDKEIAYNMVSLYYKKVSKNCNCIQFL
jgi:hypothetical protein